MSDYALKGVLRSDNHLAVLLQAIALDVSFRGSFGDVGDNHEQVF